MRHNIANQENPTHAFALTPKDNGGAGESVGLLLSLTYNAGDLPGRSCNYIYNGGSAGDISLETKGGETVLFSAVPNGMIIPIGTRRILATSTTATLLTGMY